jgi:c-di-AMP phosphodiesterase-like protein
VKGLKPRYHALIWVLVALLVLSTILPSIVLFHNGMYYGLLYSVPAVLFSGILVLALLRFNRHRIRYIARLSEENDRLELAAVQQMPMGLCVLDERGTLLHHNSFFQCHVLGGDDAFGKNLYEMLPFDPTLAEQEIFWQKRYYRVYALPGHDADTALTAFLWSDITELELIRQDFVSTRPCVLLLVVDNYEDLIQNAKESARLELGASIEKLLENFISETNGILRRLKNDRFIAVLEEQYVQQLISGKFKILDEARHIRVGDRNPVTFSIGVGHGASSLQESEQLAVQSLDMALGRGGDQAAVKTENGFRFFGGVSKGVEKKSRARTRIIACAIQELIQSSSNVLIMGHRFGDLDSVGAACGMAGAVELMGVPVSVVVDPKKNLAPQLISMMEDEVGSELFLSPQQALDIITDDTLLIIVDTHNKDILESEKLYSMAKNVAVVDHHRKTVNFVDNALVFHHEPYASSACEMVTELIQYFKLEEMVDACYGDCLLAGIMLDTKNFVMRTGVRTFEAAAFLRKIGADTVKVKCLFSGSIEAYRSRTEIVGSAEILGCHAIAAAPPETPEIRLVAPQAADELLSIRNVDAAYVIYRTGNVVSISARSLGAVNVQVIMEQLGGGGHQTMAATQIPDITEEEARKLLIRVISEAEEN